MTTLTINAQHTTESTYRGIVIVKSWFSSNFIGTVSHSAVLPNGKIISSNQRSHVTKRIRKYFNDPVYAAL